jgi:hypothetical protein
MMLVSSQEIPEPLVLRLARPWGPHASAQIIPGEDCGCRNSEGRSRIVEQIGKIPGGTVGKACHPLLLPVRD